MQENRARRVGEVARLFLKLGIIGFGGPAAHLAMMEDEVVTRRGWLTRQHFLDLVGATNLIPGPNSTELAIHIGHLRAGWPGFVAGGVCFAAPAVLITAGIAWAYTRFGALPEVAPFLYGVKPAVLAIICIAVWRLGKTAFGGARRDSSRLVIGVGVALAALLGVHEIAALLLGGAIGAAWLAARKPNAERNAACCTPVVPLPPHAGLLPALLGAAGTAAVSLWQLGLFFLQVGALLYGSGYVLIAFIQGGLVDEFHWLTQQQLLDAVAVGQFTPGPLFSTATFIGYLLAGLPGAVVATAGIFLPSFVFVALLSRVLPRLRESRWMARFLDAVNAAAIGLMVAVAAQLAAATLTAWPAWAIALVAVFVGLRWKINLAWLVLGGAAAGWLLRGAVGL